MEVEERETAAGPPAELATRPDSHFSDWETDKSEEMFKATEQEARDTTAEEHKRGKDIQDDRVRQYENYMNLEEQVRMNKESLEREAAQVDDEAEFFDFQLNQRSVHATVVHFQLRNLVWPTSNHDVFLSHQGFGARGGSVLHWNLASQTATKVLDLTGCSSPQAASSPLSPVQISTACVAHDVVAVGGFNGELVVKSLAVERPVHSLRVSHTDNSITNGIEVFRPPASGPCMLVSNNDMAVRLYDAERTTCLSWTQLPWAANYAVACPTDPKLVGIVGDSEEGILWDSSSNKQVAELDGHLDYSFAAAWHPDGNILATGNQDCCTRLWDRRKLDQSLSVLRGRMGAIRSLRYSSDGRFLAMAEAADFVHIFDTSCNYTRSQVVDIFGDIAGIGFSPVADTFFIAITLEDYSSLLTLSRKRNWESIYERNMS